MEHYPARQKDSKNEKNQPEKPGPNSIRGLVNFVCGKCDPANGSGTKIQPANGSEFDNQPS